MTCSDTSELLQLRPYLSIKHHVAGRIRIVFSAGLLEKVPRAETERLQELMSSIRGVREVRLNLAARSAVVSYDPAQIAPRVLVDLLEGDERAALQALKTLASRSRLGKNEIRQGGEA